ncbi:MAG: phosphoribosyltransferase family protein [Gemmataceae bacterium]
MFHNRDEAGRLLGQRLAGRMLRHPLVLGIPRGGVAVAAAIAVRLHAELDVVLARKLRAPLAPEVALGAVAEDGEAFLTPYADDLLEGHPGYLEDELAFQKREIARRRALFRKAKAAASIEGRSVIVVDDGIATGSTMVAAIHAVRAREPFEIIVATPVCPLDRFQELESLCDDVVSLVVAHAFRSVGEFYEHFPQVEDDEVCRLLRNASASSSPSLQETSHGKHLP